MVWIGRDVQEASSSKTPAMGRDIFHEFRLLKSLSNLALNTSVDEVSTTSLDNLVQCFTTLIIKNVFLISSLNQTSFLLKPLPLFLLL